MARPKKVIEVPGQQTTATEDTADTKLLNSLAGNAADLPVTTKPANTAAELHAATAGATVTEQTTQQRVATLLDGKALEERNAMLSALPAAGFEIVTRFEAYGFVDAQGHPLTNCLDFLDLVKQATTPVATVATLRGRAAAMVVNEDGAQHAAPGKPVLTEHGWHVPE
ncbi:hypothetical protein [Serratia fonticola]|uniref:Uncharacterized protein n=1 Tax=Serratia fonticola TaxID=47917 RepID=A0AAW3WT80_SERFO|nr:hypothetical protein [Serratia fonticola]MBC3213413.1 hypothetical protein [Serratia fonticola]NYA14272.1 hypothetical protein [Serratia fonticola]NYA33914.1 hypothetical protein [Serratia fonticola]